MPIADYNLFYFFTLGGYKLSALEIERILLEHEDIKECAVVGVSDEKWGEKVCMIAAWQIISFCRSAPILGQTEDGKL